MGRFNRRGDGFLWLGSALGALGIAVAAIAFWASVTLLQRPWRALARCLVTSVSPAPFQYQPTADDQERSRYHDEVMTRLADIRRARMQAAGLSFGDIWLPESDEIYLFPR